MIDNVYEFNKKFGLSLGNEDIFLSDTEASQYRIKFLQEELDEFIDAMCNYDRVKMFDALLDLCYVAYGTALFMGIDPMQWHAGMRVVHNCNMSKARVANTNESKRGSHFDCRKPEGWVGPETRLEEILAWSK